MKLSAILVVIFVIVIERCLVQSSEKKDTVLIAILVRNKAHILPLFLTYLSNLNYPKSRIALWIASDHNEDESIEILNIWLSQIKQQYHSIKTIFSSGHAKINDQTNRYHWSNARFKHVIGLRQAAIDYSKSIWADFLWMLDCDAIISNPDALSYLIAKQKTVIAPMLTSETTYSNFWLDMNENYYYKSHRNYSRIYNRKSLGTFSVPMIHTSILINLRYEQSDFLTYKFADFDEYNGPEDDIIIFSVIAREIFKIDLFVCNEIDFGFVPSLMSETDSFETEVQKVTFLKLLILNRNGELLHIDEKLQNYQYKFEWKYPNFSPYFDKIFVINLKRRNERRQRMQKLLEFLNLEATIVNAVDGKELNFDFLKEITFISNYEDPYHKRSMKMGEIGCFLSHYQIWKNVVDNNYEKVLILEDDVVFAYYYHLKLEKLFNELNKVPDWDLIYLGRKSLFINEEKLVENSDLLVIPKYSYWTLGYILSKSGAVKLLNADPLKKMLPIDEFLPIMYNEHPNDTWKSYFPKRDLKVYAINPLILFPMKYTGESGYVSDTEDSNIVSKVVHDEL